MTVSKNPPLTEDQIRQSAEAEARHAAAQASRHAQLDYMIAQQRQQQVAAALETIFGSEEDRFKGRERAWREDRERRGFFEVLEVVDRKCVGQ